MTTLTDDELVLFINLLMPRAMELRRQDPMRNFPETKLLGKLIEMEQEAMLRENPEVKARFERLQP